MSTYGAKGLVTATFVQPNKSANFTRISYSSGQNGPIDELIKML